MGKRDRFESLVAREFRLFVLLAALLIGLVVIVPLYFYTNYREQQLARYGITTNGTVVSTEPGCSGNSCQKVEVSYVVKGEKYLLKANTDPNDPRADVGLSTGQRVKVRYDPANPRRARLLTLGDSESGFFRFMFFFFMFVFGVPVIFLLTKRLWRFLKARAQRTR